MFAKGKLTWEVPQDPFAAATLNFASLLPGHTSQEPLVRGPGDANEIPKQAGDNNNNNNNNGSVAVSPPALAAPVAHTHSESRPIPRGSSPLTIDDQVEIDPESQNSSERGPRAFGSPFPPPKTGLSSSANSRNSPQLSAARCSIYDPPSTRRSSAFPSTPSPSLPPSHAPLTPTSVPLPESEAAVPSLDLPSFPAQPGDDVNPSPMTPMSRANIPERRGIHRLVVVMTGSNDQVKMIIAQKVCRYLSWVGIASSMFSMLVDQDVEASMKEATGLESTSSIPSVGMTSPNAFGDSAHFVSVGGIREETDIADLVKYADHSDPSSRPIGSPESPDQEPKTPTMPSSGAPMSPTDNNDSLWHTTLTESCKAVARFFRKLECTSVESSLETSGTTPSLGLQPDSITQSHVAVINGDFPTPQSRRVLEDVLAGEGVDSGVCYVELLCKEQEFTSCKDTPSQPHCGGNDTAEKKIDDASPSSVEAGSGGDEEARAQPPFAYIPIDFTHEDGGMRRRSRTTRLGSVGENMTPHRSLISVGPTGKITTDHVSGFLPSRVAFCVVNFAPALFRVDREIRETSGRRQRRPLATLPGRVPIFFTRHGQSEYNLEDRLGGNPPLTQKGLEDAQCLGAFVRSEILQNPSLLNYFEGAKDLEASGTADDGEEAFTKASAEAALQSRRASEFRSLVLQSINSDGDASPTHSSSAHNERASGPKTQVAAQKNGDGEDGDDENGKLLNTPKPSPARHERRHTGSALAQTSSDDKSSASTHETPTQTAGKQHSLFSVHTDPSGGFQPVTSLDSGMMSLSEVMQGGTNGEPMSPSTTRIVEHRMRAHTEVWTSQLQRTIQTSEPAIKHGIPRRVWPALNEIHAGVCEDLTNSEVKQAFPEIQKFRSSDKFTYRYPQGESYLDLMHRLEPIIVELETSAKCVVVVGHQAILRTLLSYFAGVGVEEAVRLDAPQRTVWCCCFSQSGTPRLIEIQMKKTPEQAKGSVTPPKDGKANWSGW